MTLVDTALNKQLEMIHLFRTGLGRPLSQALLGRHEWFSSTAPDNPELIFEHQLGYAPTYAITPEMMRVVRHGHDEMIKRMEFEQLDMNWLPSPSGFCWFGTEYPLEMAARQWESSAKGLDPDEPKRPISGVWWADQPVGYATPDHKPAAGKGVMLGVMVAREHAFSPGVDFTNFPYQHVPFDITAWSAEVPWRGASWDEWQRAHEAHETGVSTWSGASWRWLMTVIWALMEQRISVYHGSRAVRRRGAREMGAAVPPNYGEVQVVTLRREAEPGLNVLLPDGGEEHFEYSHRFLVSGHWRWQPYGPREDQKRKLIWIAPFVKGPADKPLIIRDKVHVLKR